MRGIDIGGVTELIKWCVCVCSYTYVRVLKDAAGGSL